MQYQERLKDDPHLMIKEMSKLEGNSKCADCGKAEIDWANMTLGCFLCKQCGSIHRTIGIPMKLKPLGVGNRFECIWTEFL
jgi:hypothetical protein